VKQLAQMMRKRRLVEDEPEKLWRPLKAALLLEQQRRQAAGLSPRITHRGRDLFAARATGGAVEAAEAQLEATMAQLAAATRAALIERLSRLQLGALEQVAHLFLSALGYHDIDWIKRVDRSSYAIARELGSSEPLMIGVRAGNQPVDRRGIGELRAGVVAKNVGRGMLIAARGLSEEALAELEQPGRPVAVLTDDALAAALIRAGIGVQVRSVPIGFLDGELFDRLGDQ
jgi:restriction endonuclease Mrr